MADLISVRVAVGMAGARQGQTRLVDPDNPHIAECLRQGYLQRLAEPAEEEPEAVEEPTIEDAPQ